VQGAAAARVAEEVFISVNADWFLTAKISNLEKYYGRGLPRGVTLRVNGLHAVLIVSIHPQTSRLALNTHSSGTFATPRTCNCINHVPGNAGGSGRDVKRTSRCSRQLLVRVPAVPISSRGREFSYID
jgi:hypothetical protein